METPYQEGQIIFFHPSIMNKVVVLKGEIIEVKLFQNTIRYVINTADRVYDNIYHECCSDNPEKVVETAKRNVEYALGGYMRRYKELMSRLDKILEEHDLHSRSDS